MSPRIYDQAEWLLCRGPLVCHDDLRFENFRDGLVTFFLSALPCLKYVSDRRLSSKMSFNCLLAKTYEHILRYIQALASLTGRVSLGTHWQEIYFNTEMWRRLPYQASTETSMTTLFSGLIFMPIIPITEQPQISPFCKPRHLRLSQ